MHDASVGAVRLHVGAAQALGLDPMAHLKVAGISEGELNDAEARIDLGRATRFIDSLASAAPVPSYGLWLGEHFHPAKLNLVGYLVMNAGSVRRALELYCKYQTIVGGAFVWEVQSPGEAVTWLVMTKMRLPEIRSIAQEWSAAAALTSVRVLTDEPVNPLRARFSHSQPAWREEYDRVFQCHLEFDASETSLCFTSEDLERPVLYADPSLAKHFDELCDRSLARLSQSVPVSRRVLKSLLEVMSGEEPSLPTVAQSLGMSTRSIQARLQEEGTSYKDLLGRARRELAEHHLGNPTLTIAEISFLVGFSEPSAFHRAFKRWTGTTPAEYRASVGA